MTQANVHVTAIIAAGGLGTRFGATQPKQLLPLGGVPILQRSLEACLASPVVADVVVALPAELLGRPPAYLAHPRAHLVAGGETRRASVAAAFAVAAVRADIVVVHDAARPLVTAALIAATVEAAGHTGAAVAAVPHRATIKRANPAGDRIGATVPREGLFAAQTPQAFRVDVLRRALEASAEDATDEALLVERLGQPVALVPGDPVNLKITTTEDLRMAEALIGARTGLPRVGTGYDLHRLVEGRPLVLGGVTIPFERGLLGHSDADAVCHAVTDAVLGAAGLGDIGRHFPDTDPRWKDADSLALLAEVAALVRARGFTVGNVDVTVVAERPKIAPHAEAMRARVAGALGVADAAVSVKGKTNERVDAVGAGEAIAVHAVAVVYGRAFG